MKTYFTISFLFILLQAQPTQIIRHCFVSVAHKVQLLSCLVEFFLFLEEQFFNQLTFLTIDELRGCEFFVFSTTTNTKIYLLNYDLISFKWVIIHIFYAYVVVLYLSLYRRGLVFYCHTNPSKLLDIVWLHNLKVLFDALLLSQ